MWGLCKNIFRSKKSQFGESEQRAQLLGIASKKKMGKKKKNLGKKQSMRETHGQPHRTTLVRPIITEKGSTATSPAPTWPKRGPTRGLNLKRVAQEEERGVFCLTGPQEEKGARKEF